MDRRTMIGFLCGFFGTLFLCACFVGGLLAGLGVRSRAAVEYLDCTCAPCYPDRYCRKCGHVSRDCPRLEWYFKRPKVLTNGVSFVTK